MRCEVSLGKVPREVVNEASAFGFNSVTIVRSTVVGFACLTLLPVGREIREGFLQPLDDVVFDLRRFRLPDNVSRHLSYRKVQHDHVAQLCESNLIGCSAHRSVLAEYPFDDAGLEDPHLAQGCEPRYFTVDVFEIVRPPGGRQIIL